MRIVIIGGGFLGQLLHVLWPKARVFDWRPKAPTIATRQLGPQYLWEPIPELPCRRFDVHTQVDGKDATDESIKTYKEKVGKLQDGSDWRAQFRPHMDGYDCTLPTSRVEYGKRVTHVQYDGRKLVMADGTVERYDLLISTIPLNAMLQLCGWTKDLQSFLCRPIFMHHEEATLPSDDMLVNYISYQHTDVYRQTIREGRIFTESLKPFHEIHTASVIKIQPGKIYTNDHAVRYVARLGSEGIACFGRYAVWEPDELAHETLRKVRDFKASHGV